MKIKLLVSRAGPGGVQNRGDIVDVDKDEATRLVDREMAEYVRSAKSETASKKQKTEKATK